MTNPKRKPAVSLSEESHLRLKLLSAFNQCTMEKLVSDLINRAWTETNQANKGEENVKDHATVNVR